MRLKSLWKMFHVFGFFLGCVFNKHVLFAHYSPFFWVGEKVFNFMARQSCPAQKWKDMWFGWRFATGSQEGACWHRLFDDLHPRKKTIHVFGSLAWPHPFPGLTCSYSFLWRSCIHSTSQSFELWPNGLSLDDVLSQGEGIPYKRTI